MGIRDQVQRAMFGAAIGATLAAQCGLFVAPTSDNTTIAGDYNPTSNSRQLRPYILQKHYLGGAGSFVTKVYFGRCTRSDGKVEPGTERLSNYPLKIFDDTGNGGYGAINLGKQGANGRAVITGARTALTWTASNTNTAGTGLVVTSGNPGTDWAIGTATFATGNTHAALTTTKGNIIPSTASDPSALEATTGVTLGLLSAVKTTITNNGGGTASTTWAAITATVTSTVVADALAQVAANENTRLGLMGIVVDGTTTAGSLYLNVIVDDADQDGGGDNGLSGELLLNGVVEFRGFIEGDI